VKEARAEAIIKAAAAYAGNDAQSLPWLVLWRRMVNAERIASEKTGGSVA